MRALIGIPTTPYKSVFADMELSEVPRDDLNYYWSLARLNQKIYDSVRRAGGIPIALTPTCSGEEIDEIAGRLDGFIFAGGDDIHPKFYNEEPDGSIKPDIKRDEFELKIFKRILETGKPVLGICRGAQLINVALGGTLYQDLAGVKPEWGAHNRPDITRGCVHTVKVFEPAFFRGFDEASGGKINVNSMHHQSVKKLAPGLEPLAEADDGLIEAFRLRGHKYLAGVQWHPECMSEDDKLQAGLFEAITGFAG